MTNHTKTELRSVGARPDLPTHVLKNFTKFKSTNLLCRAEYTSLYKVGIYIDLINKGPYLLETLKIEKNL